MAGQSVFVLEKLRAVIAGGDRTSISCVNLAKLSGRAPTASAAFKS